MEKSSSRRCKSEDKICARLKIFVTDGRELGVACSHASTDPVFFITSTGLGFLLQVNNPLVRMFLFKIGDGVRRAPLALVTVRNKDVRAICHVAIPLLHTSSEILLAHDNDLVRFFQAFGVSNFILFRIIFFLFQTGNARHELHVGVFLFTLEHEFGSNQIKTHCHAAEKGGYAAFYTRANLFFEF